MATYDARTMDFLGGSPTSLSTATTANNGPRVDPTRSAIARQGVSAPTAPTAPRTPTRSLSGGSGLGATSAFYGGGAAGMFSPTTAFAQPKAPRLQAPGNNLTNPGYTEQGFELTQNRLLEDPYAQPMHDLYQEAAAPTQGENYLNQNLGTLDGPGQGEQYWNQQSGQYNNPFSGEQYARQATQNFAPEGQAGAFFDQAMGQYGNFTGYSGPQNSQGQYGQSAASLANGTQGEQGLSQIAGQYGNIGQYGDPNLAAGQYAQTQQAFGDLPIANFDPFYDRARQLATQDYNRQSAGRGVYGSSEALSGVGNVITDIEAQRANRSFDAEMQRAQEQRARQQLLGEQARQGDLSSLSAFGANLAGAETFAGINNMQGNLELDRNQLLGSMANSADSQALGAQNANLAGLNAFGNIASSADNAATNRYQATTNAMNNADRTALDRLNSGADVAFRTDDSRRADYATSTNAAVTAANTVDQRLGTAASIAGTGSAQDLARLNSYNTTASSAENSRQGRLNSAITASERFGSAVASAVQNGLQNVANNEYRSFEDWYNAEIAPALQNAQLSQQDKDSLRKDLSTAFDIARNPPGSD